MKIIYAFLIFLNIVYSKVISIKSGGLKGFYMFGISKYIKENYNLDNFNFYGASAGSWNSLYLSQKNTDNLLFKQLISMNLHSFKNLYDIELQVGNFFKNNYKSHDFNLKNMHITVSIVKRFGLEKKIYGSFNTLEDTINCCMASSHIPYITNSTATYSYRNKGCIDGGFYPEPHPKNIKPDLIIYPEIYDNKIIDKYCQIDYLNIKDLINEGYNDAKKHKKELDEKLK